VWRVFWGEADLKPHLVRQWLTNERGTEPAVFDAEVRTVCEQYARAQEFHAAGVHLVSTDEKTGSQAVARLHPTLALRPGLVARQEHEDKRHGTQCLIANFEIATGEVIVPTISQTRTSADFATHIARTVATDPDACWVFIVDQLNTHQSEELVKVVAGQCGIALDLDEQGHLRNMKAMALRAAFLSDSRHRIRFVYTPKHTSWLNQVELWFSILVRKLLKRGSFTSVDDLREQLLRFIEYFNQTMAKPFKWTYKGRPLQI
jgi:transposase